MHPILEKLEHYLNNISEEQLKEDWEYLKQFNESGPDILDCLPDTSINDSSSNQ